MKTREITQKHGYETFAFGGGVIGLVGFLLIGLMPSLVYGGFAGVTLAATLFGQPIDGSLLARAIVVFGMVVGLLATAAVFVVVGAALAAAVYATALALTPTPAPNAAERTH